MPQEFPIPSVGGVWTFSGITHWRKKPLLAGNRLVSFIKRANTLDQLFYFATRFYLPPPPAGAPGGGGGGGASPRDIRILSAF